MHARLESGRRTPIDFLLALRGGTGELETCCWGALRRLYRLSRRMICWGTVLLPPSAAGDLSALFLSPWGLSTAQYLFVAGIQALDGVIVLRGFCPCLKALLWAVRAVACCLRCVSQSLQPLGGIRSQILWNLWCLGVLVSLESWAAYLPLFWSVWCLVVVGQPDSLR